MYHSEFEVVSVVGVEMIVTTVAFSKVLSYIHLGKLLIKKTIKLKSQDSHFYVGLERDTIQMSEFYLMKFIKNIFPIYFILLHYHWKTMK